MDSVQRLLQRGREYPNRCAFCGKHKDLVIDLTTIDDSGTKVEHDEKDLPVCVPCLQGYLQFAADVGDEALIFNGSKGKA